MEDQISDDVAKDRFGRLLEEVQDVSSKMCSKAWKEQFKEYL